MKKAELEAALKAQKEETEAWKARYLEEKKDDPSDERHLKSSLSYQKTLYDMSQTYVNIKSKENARLKDENMLLRADNEILIDGYRPGIAEKVRAYDAVQGNLDEMSKYQIKKLKDSNAELKQKVEEQAVLISFLKTLINDRIYDSDNAGREIEKAYEQYRIESQKPSHAKTDEETQKRIRSLREKGFSIRYIAKAEQVSVGVVHKIIHER